MNKTILLFTLYIIVGAQGNAQQFGWYYQNSPSTFSLAAIDFVNINSGWILGCDYGHSNSHILKTTNSGSTWQIVGNIPGYILFGLDFINLSTGWVSGCNSNFESVLLKTTNGGVNWNEYTLPSEVDFYWGCDIKFLNDSVGITAGGTGYIFRTNNSGANWVIIASGGGTSDITNLFFLNQITGWASGGTETGFLYKTTNSGLNWSASAFNFQSFTSVFFYNQTFGWATGSDGMDNGIIFRTSNGGATWNNFYYPVSSTNFVIMKDSLTGWATAGPYIYNTINGGFYWQIQFTSTSDVDKMFYYDSLNIWAIGSLGKILKYGNITSILTLSEISKSYSLSKNYPNPFNPTTNINFSIPKKSFVKIVIYDVFGREVERLVNYELKAGSYKVDWNAANYSSGVYFYRLSTEDYSQTRKMILIK